MNQFRSYQRGDLPSIWPGLREEDLRELESGGLTCPSAIESELLRVRSSMQTWTTEVGPVAVVGVTPTADPLAGIVWALATTEAQKRWRFGVRETERVLRECAGTHKVLFNFKDTRNTQQIEWLKRVGFTFISRTTAPNGLSYLEFVRIIS